MTPCLKVTLFMFVTTASLRCQTEVLCCPAAAAAESKCIFDDIQPNVVSRSTLRYHGGRDKRSVGDLFQPIRIKASIRDLDNIVDTSDVERLNTIVSGAISIIRKILSVVPVLGPLLMTRSSDACQSTFITGINTGKCAIISPGYVGEKCLDDFLIPDEHLEGLWTWNSTHPNPVNTEYPGGSGLPDTDTVLYVKAEHTNQCTSGQVVAYAAYCKLDQNNRPIAGIINFCPKHLQDDLYDEPKFILLAVHEIFHVLGFSSLLFNMFKECTETADGLTCIDRCTTTGTDSQGLGRLITPAVTAQAQRHFDCPESGFGGPLENQAGGSVASHWETRMMFGSIMAPIVNQPHQTFLDNLTLAVFEDSGWYKVNYEHAQDFPWGKNQGCEFGRESGCQTVPSSFFCNDSSVGCHYLREDKATCSSNSYLDECRVMKASQEDQCSVQRDGTADAFGEIFHEDSRCFVSNAVSAEVTVEPCDPTGMCYLTRCDNQSRSYEVKVGEADWQPCPEDTAITVPGYSGLVQCPSTEVICRQKTSILDLVDVACQSCLTTAVSSTTTPGSANIPTQSFVHTLCVSLEFAEVDFSILEGEGQKEVFGEAVVRGICEITEIRKSRIVILEITAGSPSGERDVEDVIVTFDLAAAEVDSDDIPVNMAYSDLEQAVLSNQMQVEYLDMNYTAVSIRIVSGMESTTSSPQTVPTTVDSGLWLILGVCAIILIAVILLGYGCTKLKRSNATAPLDSITEGDQEPGMAYRVKEKTVTKL